MLLRIYYRLFNKNLTNNYIKKMSVFGSMCDDYDKEIGILSIKVQYLEDILKSIDVRINDDYPRRLEYVWTADDEAIIKIGRAHV